MNVPYSFLDYFTNSYYLAFHMEDMDEINMEYEIVDKYENYEAAK